MTSIIGWTLGERRGAVRGTAGPRAERRKGSRGKTSDQWPVAPFSTAIADAAPAARQQSGPQAGIREAVPSGENTLSAEAGSGAHRGARSMDAHPRGAVRGIAPTMPDRGGFPAAAASPRATGPAPLADELPSLEKLHQEVEELRRARSSWLASAACDLPPDRETAQALENSRAQDPACERVLAHYRDAIDAIAEAREDDLRESCEQLAEQHLAVPSRRLRSIAD